MDWTSLEDEVTGAIQKCCPLEGDKEAALRYFDQITFNSMIEEALQD